MLLEEGHLWPQTDPHLNNHDYFSDYLKGFFFFCRKVCNVPGTVECTQSKILSIFTAVLDKGVQSFVICVGKVCQLRARHVENDWFKKPFLQLCCKSDESFALF